MCFRSIEFHMFLAPKSAMMSRFLLGPVKFSSVSHTVSLNERLERAVARKAMNRIVCCEQYKTNIKWEEY